jgi:hypothetical protein
MAVTIVHRLSRPAWPGHIHQVVDVALPVAHGTADGVEGYAAQGRRHGYHHSTAHILLALKKQGG